MKIQFVVSKDSAPHTKDVMGWGLNDGVLLFYGKKKDSETESELIGATKDWITCETMVENG